jgi:hypothetical protein
MILDSARREEASTHRQCPRWPVFQKSFRAANWLELRVGPAEDHPPGATLFLPRLLQEPCTTVTDHRFTRLFFLLLALAATSIAFLIHSASCTESSTTSAGTS